MTGITRRIRQISRWKVHPSLPSMYQLYRSAPGQYRLLKATIGLPVGFLFGLAFHLWVIERLRLPLNARLVMSGTFLMVLSAGFAFSSPARCITLLIVPHFCGKSGRSYIGTFALTFLLAGPIANIVDNAQEVTRSVRCSMGVAYNLTKSRAELRFKPMADIMKDLKDQGKQMNNITKEVKQEFLPIQFEVEDKEEIDVLKHENDEVDRLVSNGQSRTAAIDGRHNEKVVRNSGERKANEWERKLDYRCEDIFSTGLKACRRSFAEAEARCMSKLWVLGHAFCWPMKITAICELVKLVPGLIGMTCDSENAVNEGFGDGYQTAQRASEELYTNFDVNMQYKVEKSEEMLDMVTPEEVSKGIGYEFQRRVVWVRFVLDLISTFTTFLFMRVIYSSYKYHQKYVSDFKFDNVYISDYFRHIDLRRHRKKKKTLLPLKKAERKEVLFPTSKSMSSAEVKKLMTRTVRLLVEVFTYTSIILIDRLLYECLDIISTHSRIDYKQTGSHEISVKVYGNSVMGNLVRTLLKGFSKTHEIDDLASNAPCLPIPTKTSNLSIIKIYVVFAVLWILVVLEAYMMRLRRLTAGLFYPKREKGRALHLYNGMLKRRKAFLRHIRHQVRRNARERRLQSKTSVLTSLGRQFPMLRPVLRLCRVGGRSCLVCSEKERGKRCFVACTTPRCRFVYCRECWIDVHRKCYACRNQDEWSSESSSN